MAMLKWTVEFSVDEGWGEDGFDLTDERALQMLAKDLGYSNMYTEIKAKVISAPSPRRLAKLQGYHNLDLGVREISKIRKEAEL